MILSIMNENYYVTDMIVQDGDTKYYKYNVFNSDVQHLFTFDLVEHKIEDVINTIKDWIIKNKN